jgi:hypothetical protein
MVRPLLAENNAGTGFVGHGLHGRETRHTTGYQGQKHQTQKYAAEKLGIRLN